jgi:thiol:disulfide interchange protein DsbD
MKTLLAALLFRVLVLSQAPADDPLVRPSLFVSTSEVSEAFDIGIRFEIESDWYLYWINPGDAGLSVDVQWDLPEGWKAGPIRFPTPEKIVKGGITAFGYHEELVLFCRITPADAEMEDEVQSIEAHLDWLVCQESCLPGRATVSLSLDKKGVAQSVITSDRLEEYQNRFPRPIANRKLTAGDLEVRPEGATHLISLLLTGQDALEISDFYPEPIDGFITELASVQVAGNVISFRITPESSSSILRVVRGLVIIDGEGYHLEASVGG